MTWVEQARQGSKECSVRRISSGWLRIGHGRVHERGLEGADIAVGIARAAVPGGRHDRLVILDLAVLDLDPVAERAARRLGEADALDLRRPGLRIPLLDIGGGGVAGLDVGDQLVLEMPHLVAGPLRIRARAPPCGRASRTARSRAGRDPSGACRPAP